MTDSRRRNPGLPLGTATSALDTATSAMNLAMVAGVLYAGYWLITQGPLKNVFKGFDSGGGVGGPGPSSPRNESCFWARPLPIDNTAVEFGVAPTSPARDPNAKIRYTGRLTHLNVAGQPPLFGGIGAVWSPFSRQAVELWDPDRCELFLVVQTDGDGYFDYEDSLGGALSGYRVFAFYPGSDKAGWKASNSGIWTIKPVDV